MTRPLRLEIPGGWYHIMNRGLRRFNIFNRPEDRVTFLDTLAQACSRFQVGIGAYCLMDNHYHLLLRTDGPNLSRFMRHVDGVYTQRFNRANNKDGPLFRGRYRSILVDADAYLLQVLKYIHLNPVKAGLTETPHEFPWCSHRRYLKPQSCPEWFCAAEVLQWFAPQIRPAVSLYQKFMKQDQDPELEKFYNGKKLGWILGSGEFVDTMKERLALMARDEWEIPERRVLSGEVVFARILGAVKGHFKITDQKWLASVRGRENLPRSIAILLAYDLTGWTLARLAQRFEIRSYKTIATHCQRLRSRLQKEPRLNRQYQRLLKACSQEET